MQRVLANFSIITLAAMAIAGYFAAPAWVVLFGAAAILSEGWWLKLRRLHERPRVAWSAKVTTYFVTGMVAGIAQSAIAYGLGRLARVLVS